MSLLDDWRSGLRPKGIPLEEARSITRKLVQNPEQALDTLAREELGLNPEDLGSPICAAISSFLAFSVGAVLSFLLGPVPVA